MATLQTRLQDLATRIATEVKALRTLINGNAADLTALTTTAKSNLVAAINEVDGDLAGKQDTLGFTPENSANKGQANGYAGLDGTGKVPSAQLPSYVDDVLEFDDLAAFPGTGTTGILYVAKDTGELYRWSGSAYVNISAAGSIGTTDALPEGSVNFYFTNARWDARATTILGNPDTDLVATFNAGLV